MIRIRAEQFLAMCEPSYAEFMGLVCNRLREVHRGVTVRTTVSSETVGELPAPDLHELVRRSLVCALRYGIGDPPELSAFIVTRFVAAPNFDEHPAARTWLRHENLDPDARIRQLMNRLGPRDWRDIRRNYRAEAWSA